MGLLKAIGGAVAGLASGGPLGAVAGGLSGLASSGGSKTSATSNQAQNLYQSQFVDLADLDPREAELMASTLSGLNANAAGRTPEQIEADRQRTVSSIFDPAAARATEAFQEAEANAYGLNARRGAASTSRGEANSARRAALLAREIGDLRAGAELSAEQVELARRADARAAASEALQRLSALWNRQLSTSKIVKTQHAASSGRSVEEGPDTFWQSAAALAGDAIQDEESPVRRMFGG